jgi:tetratricopeptide (TPR) repeat protein
VDRKALIVVGGLLALGAFAGLFVTIDPEPRAEVSGTRPVLVAPLEATPFAAQLAALDARIEARRRAAEAEGGSWIHQEFLAVDWVERARLTGDFVDYRHADDALDAAFARAPVGGGPWLARASLDYTLHRLDRVGASLDAAERAAVILPDDQRAIRALRADVAFHRGEYAAALALYEAQLEDARDVAALVAMAQYRWKTGSFDEAEVLLDEAGAASAREGGGIRAWVHLVRATMERERGRLGAAREHVRRGLAAVPGNPMLEAALADLDLREGRLIEARDAYEALVLRSADPAHMDQLARIARARGEEEEFAMWRDRARAIHEERLGTLPVAAYGHAVEHFLELEDDPARAVELAELDRTLRPGGEAQTHLAQAYLRTGRVEDARAIVELCSATPWSTAASHATAALVFEAAGEAERAARERAAAEAIAPGSSDDLEWLRQ